MKPSLCRARCSAVRDERIVSSEAAEMLTLTFSPRLGQRTEEEGEKCKHFTEIGVDQFSQTVLANKRSHTHMHKLAQAQPMQR